MSEDDRLDASTDAELASFVDRILRLLAEKDDLLGDIKDVYAEAKGRGYDKTALGALITYLRKRSKDAAGEDERAAIFDLYLTAYERASRTHTHAREAA